MIKPICFVQSYWFFQRIATTRAIDFHGQCLQCKNSEWHLQDALHQRSFRPIPCFIRFRLEKSIQLASWLRQLEAQNASRSPSGARLHGKGRLYKRVHASGFPWNWQARQAYSNRYGWSDQTERTTLSHNSGKCDKVVNQRTWAHMERQVRSLRTGLQAAESWPNSHDNRLKKSNTETNH